MLALALSGCLAQQVTQQFSGGFDQAIGRLYEAHVLENLARCDNDEFFVQMAFSNFGSDVSRTGSLSAQVTLFSSSPGDGDGNQNVFVNLFDQSYSPTVSHSQTSRLGFIASPAPYQPAIRALYLAEVCKPPEERFFQVTRSLGERLAAYCATRRGVNEWYIVPYDRRREFCEFVHRVSFYEPPPASQPASAPAGPDSARADQ